MEVRIGIVNAPTEVKVDMDDEMSADQIRALIDESVAAGQGLVWLTDRKGRQTGFPADRIAYVELGLSGDDTRIGFS